MDSRQPHCRILLADGEKLLEFLKEATSYLLILDISMPKFTGIEAVSKVKMFDPDIKIFMLTMHKNKQFFYHAMAAGVNGYLMREDPDEELLLAIERIQDGKS